MIDQKVSSNYYWKLRLTFCRMDEILLFNLQIFSCNLSFLYLLLFNNDTFYEACSWTNWIYFYFELYSFKRFYSRLIQSFVVFVVIYDLTNLHYSVIIIWNWYTGLLINSGWIDFVVRASPVWFMFYKVSIVIVYWENVKDICLKLIFSQSL